MSVIIRSATGPCQQMTTTGNGYPWQDGDVLDAADLNAAFAAAYNNVGRNLIHNPLFNLAQRGMGPWTTTGVYTLDRWRVFFASDTDTFSKFPTNDSNRSQIGDDAAIWMLLNVFTGSGAAGSASSVFQYIEGVNRLSGKTVTVSFYAQANTSLKLGVSLDQNFGTGGSPSASVRGAGQSVTLSTVFTRYSLTFTLPAFTGKVLGTNGDDSTALIFWYSSGTTNATRAGNIGVQSGAVAIWGVQLEVGSVATPLEKPDPRYDLSNCQRFYQTGAWLINAYAPAGASVWQNMASLPVTMRANPIMAISGTPTYINCSGASLASWDTVHFVTNVTATATGSLLADGIYTASADL